MASKIHDPRLSTVRDARAVRTRASLRTAMLDLLQHKPLEQITIRDIAGAADIGYTTFFRHHPTKEALLHDVAAAEIQHLLDLALPVLQTNDTRAACIHLCAYVKERRALWTTLLTGGAASALREEFLRLTTEIAAKEHNRKKWLRSDVAILLAVGSTLDLLTWWLRQKKPVPMEYVAEVLDRIVVTPIVTDGGSPSDAEPRTTKRR